MVCWDMPWATVYLHMTMPRHMKNDMCAASKHTSSYECMCDIFSFSLHTYLVVLISVEFAEDARRLKRNCGHISGFGYLFNICVVHVCNGRSGNIIEYMCIIFSGSANRWERFIHWGKPFLEISLNIFRAIFVLTGRLDFFSYWGSATLLLSTHQLDGLDWTQLESNPSPGAELWDRKCNINN